ncbi:MAG TPA: TetR/AcrR family transcriptional regulator [Polyangia bacterium]|nr:TetR/AcrR family transcriptional regulator [Polyangia bacterium]HVY39252.1 TetR/AcrR family transcriptional regulator [Polyangia bacterium]
MTTSRRMSPDARRAQLLAVALDLFAARGYHATSISHIIEKASVARGTFYQYFRSKKEIFDSLLDQLFEQVTSAVAPIAIDTPEHIAIAIRGNIESLCRRLQDNLPMGRILLEQAVGVNETGREQLRDFYVRVLDRIERAVTVGQKLGVVRRGDAGLIAVFLLAMVKESLYQQILGTRALGVGRLVDEIFETVQQGVLLVRLH